MGFKDGTANLPSHDSALMDKVVGDSRSGRAGLDRGRQLSGGANYPVSHGVLGSDAAQGAADDLGRDKHSGAPLGMKTNTIPSDYSKDPGGEVIALDSHIRLANPRTPETQSSLMMRRGYSYSLGVTNAGQLIWGCYSFAISTI